MFKHNITTTAATGRVSQALVDQAKKKNQFIFGQSLNTAVKFLCDLQHHIENSVKMTTMMTAMNLLNLLIK